MKVLVTGGTGFVGSHIVEALLEKGHTVCVLKRQESPLRWLEGLPIEIRTGDVQTQAGLAEALEGMDCVIHVAGVTKAYNYNGYSSVNARGTANIVRACLNGPFHPEKFILVSSLAACGPSKRGRPRREEDPCTPVSHYGQSKLEAEKITLSASDRINVLVIRPPAVYGPRDRDILAFFRMLKRGLHMTVRGYEPEVSLVHAGDLARGIILAAEADTESGEKYFISDGQLYTWSQVAKLLSCIMGVRTREIRIPFGVAWVSALFSEWSCRIRGVPPLFNRQKLLEMTQEAWTCDIQRARERLGFEPSVTLKEGLREIFQWYRDNGWI
jgi:nucleoside-diphosphate-sugar epimerase